MKVLVIIAAALLLKSLHVQGSEVNKTEAAQPTGSGSPPEKRSIGGMLLPLLGGLAGMGSGEDSFGSGSGGGLLGMIGSLLSNRMGLGVGGLKMDISTRSPLADNFGSSSNSYGGSAPSPGIALNLDFSRIHDNLEKGLRIGKAAMSTGGSLLSKILQAQTSSQNYDMGPMPLKEQYPEPPSYAPSLRSGHVGGPPKHGRHRAPPAGRGGSSEVVYSREPIYIRDPIYSQRQKAPKYYGNERQKEYSDEMLGRKPQYADSATAHQPFYSESPKGSPPMYPESLRGSPSYADSLRSSPSYADSMRSSPQSFSEGLRSSSESVRNGPSYSEGLRSSPSSSSEGFRESPMSYSEGFRSGPVHAEGFRSSAEGIRSSASYSEGLRSNPEILRSSPDILRSSPEILRSNPEILRSSPEILRSNPEILRSSPQVYSEGLYADYPETLPAGSQEVPSGNRHKVHLTSYGASAESQQQEYPEENEISTGSYQREEFGAGRPSTSVSYRSTGNAGHDDQGLKPSKNGIQQAVAIPIGQYEASQSFGSSVDIAPASEYRSTEYDQGHGGSDTRDYDGNFSGSQSAGRGYLQQQ